MSELVPLRVNVIGPELTKKVGEEAKREEWSIVALLSAAEYYFEKVFRGWTWTETDGP
jgi:predicted N-acetyltransferase YhbS